MPGFRDELAAAIVEAGYGKADGSPNLYALEKAGICDSGKSSRILSGENSPSIDTALAILDPLGYELVIRKKPPQQS